jgi:glycosyltransferase involved in cell wall biosynthesis
MNEKIGVIIPAYNAALTISPLVKKISEFIHLEDIIIVEDGSFDNTFQLAKETKAILLQHPKNKGKGEALRTGFNYARERKYDAVITIDADLQHDPAYIPLFGEKVKNGDYDIIMGTRDVSLKKMPFLRFSTNFLTSLVISILCQKTIRDTQSGYRLIKVQVLKKIKLKTKKYEQESEILIRAGRMNFKIGEIKISTIYHNGKSFINPIIDTYRFLRLSFKSLFW